jgi:DNA-binding transcriptional ArsR family regulator
MSTPMEPVFRALADPHRRTLLDRLFEEDGLTLGVLATCLPDMTRFGVMKHLDVLEAAGLVTTVRDGRRKLHYLNPVPIRLVHDRWISKYAEPVVGSMAALKRQLEETPMPDASPKHVYSTMIRTTPEALWEAIIDGTKTARYYFGTAFQPDNGLTPGSGYRYLYPDGSVAADGEILAVDPLQQLKLTFQARWDPALVEEGPVTQSWEIERAEDGVCKLTVITEGLVPGSQTESEFTGGIVYIVSGLKTYLETGEGLAA